MDVVRAYVVFVYFNCARVRGLNIYLKISILYIQSHIVLIVVSTKVLGSVLETQEENVSKSHLFLTLKLLFETNNCFDSSIQLNSLLMKMNHVVTLLH